MKKVVNELTVERDAKKKAKKLAEAVQYLKDSIGATEGAGGEIEQVCDELATALDAYEKDQNADALDTAADNALDYLGFNVLSVIQALLQIQSVVTGKTVSLK